jgi:integrase
LGRATLEVRLAVLPMHEDFAGWLSAGPREIGQSLAFPELVERRITGNGGLSAQFRAIVALEGVTGRIVTWEGKWRATNSKTFHGLRHSFIFLMANAGVAPEIRQKLAGHSDAKTHAIYTHHEIDVLRAAVARLPAMARAKWVDFCVKTTPAEPHPPNSRPSETQLRSCQRLR